MLVTTDDSRHSALCGKAAFREKRRPLPKVAPKSREIEPPLEDQKIVTSDSDR